jgi:hypothetical protein
VTIVGDLLPLQVTAADGELKEGYMRCVLDPEFVAEVEAEAAEESAKYAEKESKEKDLGTNEEVEKIMEGMAASGSDGWEKEQRRRNFVKLSAMNSSSSVKGGKGRGG